MATAMLILFAVVIVLFTIWYRKYEKRRRIVDKIPGPPALPILGNALQFKRTSRGKSIVMNFIDII